MNIFTTKHNNSSDSSVLSFDIRENDPERLHQTGLRLMNALSGEEFDIEIAGALHLFMKALGVTQEEMNQMEKSKSKILNRAHSLVPNIVSEVNRLLRSGAVPDPEIPPISTLFKVALENVSLQFRTSDMGLYRNLQKM